MNPFPLLLHVRIDFSAQYVKIGMYPTGLFGQIATEFGQNVTDNINKI